MTLAEFKAWFEGFTEEMDEAPTKKQWERIKKRVKEVDGAPVTERVFIDRYVERRWPPQRYWEYLCTATGHASVNGLAERYRRAVADGWTAGDSFNSHQALCVLGRAEYKSEAA